MSEIEMSSSIAYVGEDSEVHMYDLVPDVSKDIVWEPCEIPNCDAPSLVAPCKLLNAIVYDVLISVSYAQSTTCERLAFSYGGSGALPGVTEYRIEPLPQFSFFKFDKRFFPQEEKGALPSTRSSSI